MAPKPLKPKRSCRRDPIKRLEAPEQKAYVKWFRLQYPQYAKALMANMAGVGLSGNENQRAAQVSNQKAMGFKKGVSDIQIAVPNDNYVGLWIEFKKPGSTIKDVRPDQIEHAELMNQLGHFATWSDTFEKAKEITQEYMKTAVKIR